MSRLLLDTHVWLWFSVSPDRLPDLVRTALVDPDNEVWVSVVSVWELAIKTAIGKLALPEPIEQFVATYGYSAGFSLMPIEARHAAAVATLPQLHHDPFDRLLVCQAQAEGHVLVTADGQVSQYSAPTLWAGK